MGCASSADAFVVIDSTTLVADSPATTTTVMMAPSRPASHHASSSTATTTPESTATLASTSGQQHHRQTVTAPQQWSDTREPHRQLQPAKAVARPLPPPPPPLRRAEADDGRQQTGGSGGTATATTRPPPLLRAHPSAQHRPHPAATRPRFLQPADATARAAVVSAAVAVYDTSASQQELLSQINAKDELLVGPRDDTGEAHDLVNRLRMVYVEYQRGLRRWRLMHNMSRPPSPQRAAARPRFVTFTDICDANNRREASVWTGSHNAASGGVVMARGRRRRPPLKTPLLPEAARSVDDLLQVLFSRPVVFGE